MSNAVIRKLEALGEIADEDRAWLVQLIAAETKAIPARTELVQEGEHPRSTHLLISGMACQYKMLGSGKRQIVAFVVPGDFCNSRAFTVGVTDYSVATLTSSEIVEISATQVARLFDTSFARPIMASAMIEQATLRAWLTNIGRQNSEGRTAHLICELHARFETVGLVRNLGFELPMTQADWADALGLSLVHINRTLRELRLKELAIFQQRKLKIFDLPGLHAAAGFKSGYLHPGGPPGSPSPPNGSSSPVSFSTPRQTLPR